jgi:hypothetical protein
MNVSANCKDWHFEVPPPHRIPHPERGEDRWGSAPCLGEAGLIARINVYYTLRRGFGEAIEAGPTPSSPPPFRVRNPVWPRLVETATSEFLVIA